MDKYTLHGEGIFEQALIYQALKRIRKKDVAVKIFLLVLSAFAFCFRKCY